jgi:hypothetical protein
MEEKDGWILAEHDVTEVADTWKVCTKDTNYGITLLLLLLLRGYFTGNPSEFKEGRKFKLTVQHETPRR